MVAKQQPRKRGATNSYQRTRTTNAMTTRRHRAQQARKKAKNKR